MVGSLGATLSGVTFPVTSHMRRACFSYLFPVRHFTEAAWILLRCRVCLLLAVGSYTLHLPIDGTADTAIAEMVDKKRDKGRSNLRLPSPCPPTALSTASVIRHEWHAIATNPAILLVLAGGIFPHGLLYNYMYAPNLVRKAPVAVVDLSHSALSREYIRLLDATPQTAVYGQTPNILEARQWMKQGDVAGILYLPADFEARVARGETSVFVLYAATDAFLNFKGLQEPVRASCLP